MEAETPQQIPLNNVSKFSSLGKLKRVTILALRFLRIVSSKTITLGHLMNMIRIQSSDFCRIYPDELKSAELILIRDAQQKHAIPEPTRQNLGLFEDCYALRSEYVDSDIS